MNSIKLVLGGLALAALTGCKTDLVCDGTGVISGGLEPDKTVPEFFSTVIWDGWFSSPKAEKMDEHGTALFYSDATDPGTRGQVLVSDDSYTLQKLDFHWDGKPLGKWMLDIDRRTLKFKLTTHTGLNTDLHMRGQYRGQCRKQGSMS